MGAGESAGCIVTRHSSPADVGADASCVDPAGHWYVEALAAEAAAEADVGADVSCANSVGHWYLTAAAAAAAAAEVVRACSRWAGVMAQ